MKKAVYIGTSGWHYDHWKGPFYPAGTGSSDFLKLYAEHFRSVEINSSFYRLPDEKTLRTWAATVSEDFIFTVKASRYITHRKKLKDPETTLPKLLERIKVLGERLGPVLFQLPPNWNCNAERLRDFLKALPGGYRYAFEFRDPSWFTAKINGLLKDRNAACCIYDFNGRQSPRTVTADFVYIRLHGPGGAYEGRYGTVTLQQWTERIHEWRSSGNTVYCYFDNDQAGYAAMNAKELRDMVEMQ